MQNEASFVARPSQKGHGSIAHVKSQTALHACLQRVKEMQISLWCHMGNIPMPLTSSVVLQMMARFRNFYSL